MFDKHDRSVMKAIYIEKFGSADVVRFGDLAVPVPAADELLVAIKYASVNPVDGKIRDGKLKALLRTNFPLTLGSDVAGVVHAIGRDVKKFRVGDEVNARLDKTKNGAFAQYCVVVEKYAALKPRSVSYAQAAALPLAGLTAWQALHELAQLQAGQKILIHAASGGVGHLALQLAKSIGAWVAVTASPRNFQWLKSLGADVLIDYKSERFEEKLSAYDVVFDTQGGDVLRRSFAVLKPGGVLVTVGGMPSLRVAKQEGMRRLLWPIIWLLNRPVEKRARRAGVRFEYLFMQPNGDQLGQLNRLVESGKLVPTIGREFALAHTEAALTYVDAGHARGKVLINVASAEPVL
jgi:alcohol dehydrogenase